MNARELLEFLFDDPAHEAAAIVSDWITGSRPFHSFAVANRSKIRKKLRTAATPESLRSVLLELEVARHFAADRRCQVEYERYGQRRVRSPDLTVTFRTHTVVHLEATYVQPAAGAPEWEAKLIGLVCHKIGQLMPESLNVLVIASEGGTLALADVEAATKRLKQRAERRENEILTRFGFTEPAGFFKQFQWLSGILTWTSPRSLWANPQARRPLPAPISALLTS